MGYPQPTGRYETLAADTVILALGQESDTAFLRELPESRSRATASSRSRRPSRPAARACLRAATWCAASARSRSASATARRRRATSTSGSGSEAAAASAPKHELASFDKLHLWYFGDNARREQSELAVESASPASARCSAASPRTRRSTRPGGASGAELLRVRRLPGRLPEDAVIKLGVGSRYRFDHDKCTGCGVCAEQCPVHAIDMVAEAR